MEDTEEFNRFVNGTDSVELYFHQPTLSGIDGFILTLVNGTDCQSVPDGAIE